MKVSVNKKQKEFEPIEITITIESRNELFDLWHRTNLAHRDVQENCSDEGGNPPIPNRENCFALWNNLNKVWEGLK